MKNRELAKIFYEMSEYLKMEENSFRSIAYRKAGLGVENLDKSIEDIYQKGGRKALEDIPGIGKSIALKIEEYIKKGKIEYYQKLKKKTPINLEEITGVEGIGPKQAKVLYQKLKIRNLKDLEKAVKSHKIAPLFGFGAKKEKNILEGINFLKKSKGRFILGEIMPTVKEILRKLGNLEGVDKISVAGSVRRMKETVGDVDILIAVKENASSFLNRALKEEIMDFFVSQPGITKIWGKGPTKSSVRTKEGFDIDLRVVSIKSYGSALQYFTGSKEHNIATRKIALEKGLKLNEYGVFKEKRMIAGKNEKEVYEAIGLPLIPPEMRMNRGEIEAALRGKLPEIIGYNGIKGDLHCHSNWNGGRNSIAEMAEAAQGMDYQYLGISDHTKFLRIEHGLNEQQISQQRKEIEKLNKKFKVQNSRFKILQGAETNILKNGLIDISGEALKKLDYTIAGVHSNLKMSKKEMTERIIRAMKNPNINIVSHPTGRIIKRRDEYQIDFDRILRAAKKFRVILEINSSPDRLDLKDFYIKRAKEAGVKMVINTDAHHKDQLSNIIYGIAQARRGWAEKKDIINAWPLNQLLKLFS